MIPDVDDLQSTQQLIEYLVSRVKRAQPQTYRDNLRVELRIQSHRTLRAMAESDIEERRRREKLRNDRTLARLRAAGRVLPAPEAPL